MSYRCEYCEEKIDFEVMIIELPGCKHMYFCDDSCFNEWAEEHSSYDWVDADD